MRPGRAPTTAAILASAALLAFATEGCARAPSPLTPTYQGSVGLPHHGVLTHPAELPREGHGYRFLSDNGRRYGTARVVRAIVRAAATVDRERPGSTLMVGDLSAETGGKISSHASHRTGRDADLLLYMTTLEGVPTTARSFAHVGTDGLAFDDAEKRWLRFDVERQWLLVKSLLLDEDARVQWLFVSRPVEAMLLEWARARDESTETVVRAMDAMQQPGPPAQAHDDHIHVRVACDPVEIAAGCEPTGPTRPWIAALDARARPPEPPSNSELVHALLRPLAPSETTASLDAPPGSLDNAKSAH